MTLTVIVSGNYLHQLNIHNFVNKSPFLKAIIDGLKWIVPNLDYLNIKDFVVYQNTLDSGYILGAFFYAILYILFLSAIACLIFENKELE